MQEIGYNPIFSGCHGTKVTSKSKHTNSKRASKVELHVRNPHRSRYDFALLADSSPELASFIIRNKFNNDSIDFANPAAVKALNRALLNHFYGIEFWDIPEGYLCPPIPGRADYIHHLADLMADSNNGVIPRGKGVKVLDVGVGANCVYPIIGRQEYGWQFVGSDINSVAVETAKTIVRSNSGLTGAIDCRLQSNPLNIFKGIWQDKERFDVTLCNPPFHSTSSKMQSESRRKWKGLNKAPNDTEPKLNFGGQGNELWCEGGEEGFIKRMIEESVQFGEQCYWFTSLVSKQASLGSLYKQLKAVGAQEVKTIDMAQGQKVSRFVAWTFLMPDQQDYWRDYYWSELN